MRISEVRSSTQKGIQLNQRVKEGVAMQLAIMLQFTKMKTYF